MSESIDPRSTADGQNDVEAVLKSLYPPNPDIDRDELMYRCGWEAAVAEIAEEKKQAVAQPVASKTKPQRSTGWIWPAVSLLSSSAAILFGVLLMIPPGESQSLSLASTDPETKQADFAKPLTGDLKNEVPSAIQADVPAIRFQPRRNLVRWIDELPAGQVLNSGFGQTPQKHVAPRLPQLESDKALDSSEGRPPTRQRLMEELLEQRPGEKSGWPLG